MSDEATPGPDLRQMIVNTIIVNTHICGSSECECEPALVIGASLMEGNRIIEVEATPEILADVVMVAVRHELDRRDAEIRRLREQVAGYENGITWHTTCLGCAKLLDSCYAETMRADQTKAERDQLKATIARVKALAEDMRTWCSPDGIATLYAQRIDEAIVPPPPVGIEADSEAEFAAIIVATLRKHRAEVHPEHNEHCGNCAVIKGAPEVLTVNLGDLPAVREFAANLDPREEG